MKLWIVGRYVETKAKEWTDIAWHLFGVFDSEDKARNACSTPNDFFAPVFLNERAPEEAVPWPNVCYPLAPKPEPPEGI